MDQQAIPAGSSTRNRRDQWNTIGSAIMLSWVVTILTVWAMQRLPIPWRMRFLSAETVSIGGGPGQGSIILSAELDGMVMATFKGAASGDSLTMTVSPKGNPTIAIDSDQRKSVLVLDFPPGGQPRFRMMDAASGQKGWSVTLDANGQPVIEPR